MKCAYNTCARQRVKTINYTMKRIYHVRKRVKTINYTRKCLYESAAVCKYNYVNLPLHFHRDIDIDCLMRMQ